MTSYGVCVCSSHIDTVFRRAFCIEWHQMCICKRCVAAAAICSNVTLLFYASVSDLIDAAAEDVEFRC